MSTPGHAFPLINIVPTSLGESALQAVAYNLRAGFNGEIDRLLLAYNDTVPIAPNQRVSTVNLPKMSESEWYMSEVIEPKTFPAAFILLDSSRQMLEAQNFEMSEHTIYTVLVTEDVEIGRMLKTVWRYGIAAWRCLHDKNFHNTYVWVDGFEYSPTYTRGGTGGRDRQFRKDITMRVRARSYEPWS
jgi:hypothetical protein